MENTATALSRLQRWSRFDLARTAASTSGVPVRVFSVYNLAAQYTLITAITTKRIPSVVSLTAYLPSLVAARL